MKHNTLNSTLLSITPSLSAESSQQNMEASQAVHFAAYHEMADIPVTFKNLEEEFISRLALVEDLQKRFHFMMTELKSVGLRTED
jgi:hypothetical protein